MPSPSVSKKIGIVQGLSKPMVLAFPLDPVEPVYPKVAVVFPPRMVSIELAPEVGKM